MRRRKVSGRCIPAEEHEYFVIPYGLLLARDTQESHEDMPCFSYIGTDFVHRSIKWLAVV